jgi:hypothetical protein
LVTEWVMERNATKDNDSEEFRSWSSTRVSSGSSAMERIRDYKRRDRARDHQKKGRGQLGPLGGETEGDGDERGERRDRARDHQSRDEDNSDH